MSRDKDPECRGLLTGETANAIKVKNEKTGAEHWIPRSQIGYLRKDKEGEKTRVVFSLPEWMIEKKQCWDLVP